MYRCQGLIVLHQNSVHILLKSPKVSVVWQDWRISPGWRVHISAKRPGPQVGRLWPAFPSGLMPALGKSQGVGYGKTGILKRVVDKVILDGSSLEMLKLKILLNIAMRHARSQQLAVHFPGLRRRKCLVLCFSNLLNSLAFSIVEDMQTLRCRHGEMCTQ